MNDKMNGTAGLVVTKNKMRQKKETANNECSVV